MKKHCLNPHFRYSVAALPITSITPLGRISKSNVRAEKRCYLCKGDYDDGGQYCIGFGGAMVDRRLSEEVLKVISPLGVEASMKAMEELGSGEAAQRAALSSKLEQLEYEAKRAFEQYDVVDARNRLAAAELERRWNEKLEEIDTVRQQLACLAERRCSLSPEEEASILSMGEQFAEVWHIQRQR
jgi:hypothetical protein